MTREITICALLLTLCLTGLVAWYLEEEPLEQVRWTQNERCLVIWGRECK